MGIIWLVAGIARGATGEAAEPEGVTLDRAQGLAYAGPSAQIAFDARLGADARLDQVRAARMPNLGVSGSVNLWNEAQEIEFGPSSFTVRDQVTADLTVHAAVPLTAQIALGQRAAAAAAGVDSAEAQLASARAEARYQATDAWFLALQAEAQLDIAVAQSESLSERVRAAQTAFDGGTLTRNDVLKTQIALARAEQAVIAVRAARDAARARLGLAIGNGGQPVAPAGDPPAPPAAVADVEALIDQALANRNDLAALRAQQQAASDTLRATSLEVLPQLAAIGVYTHNEGQSFAPPDAAYVGAKLDWPLFAGGAHHAQMRGARAAAAEVGDRLALAEAGVRVEVRTRADALAASLAAWDVAERSIAQAEENLRIQDTLREAGSGTMTDLLDAEAELVEARSRTAAALYDAHRAHAALERAVGAPLSRGDQR